MPNKLPVNRIVLQPRDFSLLHDLLDSRLMTIKHSAALHFNGRTEAAKKRMQKLHAAGMIVQRARRPQEPAVYSLGRAGYLRLKQEGMLDTASDAGWPKLWKRQQIGELMLRHELAVMDVKTAFVKAIAENPHLELVEISTSPDKHKFRVIEAVPASGGGVRFRSLYAKPDGLLHILEYGKAGSDIQHFCFLEVDMGTESLARLLQKARHYSQHYRKGGFAVRLGFKRGEYRQAPFRVLLVFKSANRRDNFAERLQEAGPKTKTQVSLSTFSEMAVNPLKAIWKRSMER